jgi:hypothetical protein
MRAKVLIFLERVTIIRIKIKLLVDLSYLKESLKMLLQQRQRPALSKARGPPRK